MSGHLQHHNNNHHTIAYHKKALRPYYKSGRCAYGLLTINYFFVRSTSDPWVGKEAQTPFVYYWNFCTNLVGVPSQVDQTGPATVIQLDTTANGAHAWGRITNQSISEISTSSQ